MRGWERAADAQRRIVKAIGSVTSQAVAGDVAGVSHGAVGALLLGHLKAAPISRAEDQPGNGGGHVYTFDATTRRLLSDWRKIEDAFSQPR